MKKKILENIRKSLIILVCITLSFCTVLSCGKKKENEESSTVITGSEQNTETAEDETSSEVSSKNESETAETKSETETTNSDEYEIDLDEGEAGGGL